MHWFVIQGTWDSSAGAYQRRSCWVPWWTVVPAILSVVGLVILTALEDRTLLQELDGYAAYAERVRYRLMPGVW